MLIEVIGAWSGRRGLVEIAGEKNRGAEVRYQAAAKIEGEHVGQFGPHSDARTIQRGVDKKRHNSVLARTK